MKARYDREDDVLTLQLSKGTVDHAEEVDGVIVHFSADDRPLLLEVLDASDLIQKLGEVTRTAATGVAVTV